VEAVVDDAVTSGTIMLRPQQAALLAGLMVVEAAAELVEDELDVWVHGT
jgi:hypothetical protein